MRACVCRNELSRWIKSPSLARESRSRSSRRTSMISFVKREEGDFPPLAVFSPFDRTFHMLRSFSSDQRIGLRWRATRALVGWPNGGAGLRLRPLICARAVVALRPRRRPASDKLNSGTEVASFVVDCNGCSDQTSIRGIRPGHRRILNCDQPPASKQSQWSIGTEVLRPLPNREDRRLGSNPFSN